LHANAEMAADNANDEGAFGFGFETPECGKMVFLFFFCCLSVRIYEEGFCFVEILSSGQNVAVSIGNVYQ
jgi:hypothetical protein